MKPHLHDTELWEKVAAWDDTLAVKSSLGRALQAKRLHARRYSASGMFKHMAQGQTYLVNDLAIQAGTHARSSEGEPCESVLAAMIQKAFSHQDTARVQRGPAKVRSRMPVAELLQRWQHGRGIISTTDLHFRGTPAEQHIDLDPLSRFNLLLGFGKEVSFVEMMTLVIGTAGNVTDSHTDDCDGSNHCFTGSKLWLVWDRIEGQKKGLQDCSHDLVYDKAAFDMRTFLSLKSSRWFTITTGETLFLPGHLAHKVVTLERYLGFGSFYLTFPNLLLSFRRWLLDDPYNITSEMLEVIAARVAGWRNSRDPRSFSLKKNAGIGHFDFARKHWLATEAAPVRQKLLKEAVFASLMT